MVNSYIDYGASPRAAIAIAEAARGYALFDARPTVGFEDVHAVSSAVLNHRLILNYKARFDKMDQLWKDLQNIQIFKPDKPKPQSES